MIFNDIESNLLLTVLFTKEIIQWKPIERIQSINLKSLLKFEFFELLENLYMYDFVHRYKYKFESHKIP